MEKIYKEIYLFLKRNHINLEEDIYYYGIEILISYLIYFLFTFSILLYFDFVIEALFYIVPFIILRSYVGGLHLNSKIGCFTVSIFTSCIFPFLAQLFPVTFSLIIIIHIVCIILICKVQVMDHSNKVLTNEEKLYLSKKGVYFVLLSLIFATLLFSLGDRFFVKEILFVPITYIFEFMIYIQKHQLECIIIKRRKND